MTTAAPVGDTATHAKVLIIDDDRTMIHHVTAGLRQRGFLVDSTRADSSALAYARQVMPDAVILDVEMADTDGFELLRRLRAEDISAPVLFLTAQDQLHDKITGLTVGGDDYIVKPFSMEELIARLRGILRRVGPRVDLSATHARITFADIEIDEDSREAWKAGAPVSLSPTEFTLLRYLIANAGHAVSKRQILDHVWSYDFTGDMNVVESYISYLRRKVDRGDNRLLHTLRGVGYILREAG